jgi:DNA-3-methyladenine glycosylase
MPRRLARSFFRRPTLDVARSLLGQRLVRIDRGQRLSGWIVETEAYIGQHDLGCHARAGRTERNKTMWGEPGHIYVYFTYGMHWCMNVVTEDENFPAAVLVRGLVPAEGTRRMRARRGEGRPVADGPAKLCQALDIDGRWDGYDLCAAKGRLFIEPGPALRVQWVKRGPRVGLDRVPEPWKSKPWRFRVSDAAMSMFAKEKDG